jgi:chemotaxis protein methyltransferase CheR
VTTKALAELIERTTGLALERGGVSVALDRFVAERLNTLGLASIEDYVSLAANPTGTEQRRLIDAITVPHTWFYRDQEQLQTIAKLMAEAPAGRLAVWVAGCATGEEAYTLAMIGRSIGRDVSVLATDVNETALEAARRGVYSTLAIRDVPPNERRWLSPQNNRFSVDPVLRQDVSFMRHNLVDSPPQATNRGGWDLVVCRNVLIYFAASTAVRVLERFGRALREGGSLVVGASEVVFAPPPGLELVPAGSRLVLRRPVRGQATTPTGPLPPVRPAPAPLPPVPVVPVLVPPLPVLGSTVPPPPPPTPPRPVPAANSVAPREALRAVRDDELVAALGRGHALFERGEVASAIQIYAELARSYPSVAEVWLFLGIARYASGEVDAAANALRASLCLDPALWPAGFYLARAYERLGRRADALQQYDLVAVDELQPLALQSTSAVINELRAFRHDFRNAARRVATERATTSRRLLK